MLEKENNETDIREIEVDTDEDTGANQASGQAGEVIVETGSSQEDDQFSKAESATQKRIDRLTKKMRTAEREREEALRYAQKVQQEADELKTRVTSMDQNYINEYSSRVDTQMSAAETKLKSAMEIGDTAQAVEAQKEISRLTIEADRASQAKAQQESLKNTPQPTQQAQPTPQPVKPPDPKAQKWAEKNDWFGTDEAMTYAAFGIHKRMVENEGFDPSSNEYYTELDNRMRTEFPHKLNGGAEAPSTESRSNRPAQTVASVSRSATSGRSKSRKVKLTPTQVDIAKRLGVPIEEYAKYVKE
tara:strand:- start:351 stop:1256 length:906 start_codon:yes stop_codon:yes gene_type:complete